MRGRKETSNESKIENKTWRYSRHGMLNETDNDFMKSRIEVLKEKLLQYEALLNTADINDIKNFKAIQESYNKTMRLYVSLLKIPKLENKESTLETALYERKKEGIDSDARN
jgi:hypothetical protein